MSKIRKFILYFHVILIILFGTFIAQISSQLYRYNRIYVFVEPDELSEKFFLEIHDKITFLWLIWGAMIIILSIQTLIEFRKKR